MRRPHFTLILAAVVLAAAALPALAQAKTTANLLSQPDWFRYGVNPWDKDTDNDGWTDDWEVKSGYCPTFPGALKITDQNCKKGTFDLKTGRYTPPANTTFYPARDIRAIGTCNALSQVLAQKSAVEPLGTTEKTAISGDEGVVLTRNDSRYLYTIQSRALRIVELSPTSSKPLLSSTLLADTFRPERLYVYGDTALVMGPAYNTRTYEESATHLEWWDLRNRRAPRLLRVMQVEGALLATQLYDGSVYAALSLQEDATAPRFSATAVLKGLWFYRDLSGRVMSDMAAKPWQILSRCNDAEVIAPLRGQGIIELAAFSLRYPLSKPFQTTLIGVAKTDELHVGVAGTWYLLSPDFSYSWLAANASERTEIYRLTLGKNTIQFSGAQTVPGTFVSGGLGYTGGILRLATTIQKSPLVGQENNFINNLYFLDADLDRIAWYEGFLPWEKIIDATFIGERIYVRTDMPERGLFVMNFGSDRIPKEIGRLNAIGLTLVKSAGKNSLIALGAPSRLTTTTPGFAWHQGLKLSLLNVENSDRFAEWPEFIGDRGTVSPVFDTERRLVTNGTYVVLPVSRAVLPAAVKAAEPTSTLPFATPSESELVIYRAIGNQLVYAGAISPMSSWATYPFASDLAVDSFIRGTTLYAVSPDGVEMYDLSTLGYIRRVSW